MIHYVIPVLNEAPNIGPLLERLDSAAASVGESYRVIAVDDGSTDDSIKELKKYESKCKMDIFSFGVNRGIGEVIKTGFSKACTTAPDDDPIVFIESDGSNDPSTLGKMIEKFRSGADIISASRYMDGGASVNFPFKRSLVSKSANFLLRSGFPLPNTTDYTYFLKMYRSVTVRQAFEHYGEDIIKCKGFTANAEFFIKMCLLTDQFEQVPTTYNYSRGDSLSKFNAKREILDFIFLFRVCRAAMKDYVTITSN